MHYDFIANFHIIHALNEEGWGEHLHARRLRHAALLLYQPLNF